MTDSPGLEQQLAFATQQLQAAQTEYQKKWWDGYVSALKWVQADSTTDPE